MRARLAFLLLLIASVAPAGAQNSDPVILSLDEPLPLQTLLDYVSQELRISFIYDPSLVSGEVELSFTDPLPAEALEGVLGIALRGNGLAVVETGIVGVKRIVAVSDAMKLQGGVAEDPVGPPNRGNALSVSTQTFSVRTLSATEVAEALRPLLTSPEGIILVSDGQGLIVVADEPAVLKGVGELIKRIDSADTMGEIQTVELKHAVARDLADSITVAMQAHLNGQGMFNQAEGVLVKADPRSNRLLLVAPKAMVPMIVKLIDELDQPIDRNAAPIRRYKLTNTKAREVLRTLRSVAGIGGGDLSEPDPRVNDRQRDPFSEGSGGFADDFGFDDDGGGGQDFDEGAGGGAYDDGLGGGFADAGGRSGAGAGGGFGDTALVDTGISAGSLNGRKVTLAADVNTNSIIVVADSATHEIFADLINLLDERRPQVQIETTLVALNTTNDYSLGVEFGTRSENGGGRLITFSSFGINDINPAAATVAPTVGAGLTAALLDTNFADVVLRAFAEDGNSRVLSAPTLLVNDNERATLRSIREEPTTSVSQGVNSDQVSFRGFVSAGTQLTVTPNISEGGYLQLEYRVEVNSFLAAAGGTEGLPPPRQTDSVGSRVTIPDGFTVVAGGLTRSDTGDSIRKIPLLGDIPLLGELFKQRSRDDSQITLFVFLKPTILRDDDFADLRGLSESKLRDAGLPGNEPWDGPDFILE